MNDHHNTEGSIVKYLYNFVTIIYLTSFNISFIMHSTCSFKVCGIQKGTSVSYIQQGGKSEVTENVVALVKE
jgi:hypothetical protein